MYVWSLRKKLTTVPFEEWLKELGPLNQEDRRRPPNGGWVVKRKGDLFALCPVASKRDSWILRETGGFQLKRSKNFLITSLGKR